MTKYLELENTFNSMVEIAKIELKGDCPLHEDEAIIWAANRIAELEKDNVRLTSFLDWVDNAVASGHGVCGDAAQVKMFELGMLTREIYNPEIHTLEYGSECDEGDYIYFRIGKGQ